MSKYQDALDRISTNFGECEVGSRYYDLELHKDIQIIAQGLDQLEKLEKAIEILKNKRVCMFTLLSVPKYEYYNDFCREDDKLIEEEFNLLKGVLE